MTLAVDVTAFVRQPFSGDPADQVLYKCLTCSCLIASVDLDGHASKRGHKTSYIRTFRSKEDYERWYKEQK